MSQFTPTDREIEDRIGAIVAMNPKGRHSLHQIMFQIEHRSDLVVKVPRVVKVINDLVTNGVLNLACIEAGTNRQQFGVTSALVAREERASENMVE